ncbi:hypothetical protein BGX24_008873 [Mortierella sp. AD032]|nr:hypothetical protein BGX24_008873 [Mortierella sp. AD032]
MTTTLAAPITKNDGGPLDSARDGPYNLSVQAGIAGAILIVLGLILCFLGVRFFRICMFLIGFYFFGNISYIGMANGGVTSQTLLLVISIVVGILGGLLLVCCSRLGVAVLGAMALYTLGLWILGWKSGGVIQSSTGRGILLGVLAVVDFFAHTGFITQADSFINSKNNLDARVGNLSGKQYALLATFIVLSILGMIVQFRWWGRRNFRPAHATAAPPAQVVYTEKPSRFGIFRRRH